MIFNLDSLFKRLLYIIFAAVSFLSCTNHKNKSGASKYSSYILGKDGKEYIVEADSLTSGVLLPERDGILLDGKDMDRDILVKDSFIYHLNRKTEFFSKFAIKSNGLVVQKQIKIPAFSLENFNWISKDTLMITGLNTSGFNSVKYLLIEVNKMTIVKSGDLDIPKPVGKFKWISIGFLKKQGHSMVIGYTYNFPVSISDYSTSDTTYVSKLSYPEMKLIKTVKDVRSTYPGGENAIQSYSFTHQNGDFYFMACPGIALGNRPDLSTGIFRIKANHDEIDQSYFFNISDSKIDNHAYGMWYLGGNKVIIRSERKDLFTGLGDHYSVAHFEFYVLDLETKTIVKLALPLDKGTRRECVIVEGDVAYISVNSDKEGNFIWNYDIKTGALKKGAQLSGDTDFILRIDRLTE